MHIFQRYNIREKGFAMVATIILMALIALLAIGLLNLSVISTRSSDISSAKAEAQTNARLALAIALGELQKTTGADMRITAPADVVDKNNPPLTGVWRSWEGSDHTQSGFLAGRPIKPVYEDKTISTSSGGRFITWLVSGTEDLVSPYDAASLVSKTPSSQTVPLVSNGSLASGDDRQVHIVPTNVHDHGAFAWWISPENQKAHIPKPHEPSEDNIVGWSRMLRSHSVADPEPLGLDTLLTDPSPSQKAISLSTVDLIAGNGASVRPHELFHDLSTSSTGLLTNVATGGWRKDLSLLTETWSSQPDQGLELFQLSPTESLKFTKPIEPTNYTRAGSLFYAWSSYRQHRAEQTFHRRGAVTSWTCLANHATLYKRMTSSNGIPQIEAQTWPYRGAQAMYDGLHRPWVMPQIARIQIIASHYATSFGAAPGKLKPAVLFTPVITLWNPYGVEVSLPGKLHIRTGYALPLALRYNFPERSNPDYWAVQGPQTNKSYPDNRLQPGWNYGWQIRFEEKPLVLKPGETRVYSPKEGFLSDDTYINRTYTTFSMEPGVRYNVGSYYTLDRILQPGIRGKADIDPVRVSLPPNKFLDCEAKFDVGGQNLNGEVGCGLFFQWNVDRFGDPQHGNVTAHYRPEEADQLYPPLIDLTSASLAECQENPVPFLSIIYGSRIANHSANPTKGMVQANPLVTFTATGLNSWYANLYPGGRNPLNSPWDFSFIPHTSGPGDDMLPNIDNESDSGYIMTGVRKADGVARCTMVDLPLRPIASLAELTHWHVRGLNPVGPHGHNLIANSDASPLLPMDDVVDPLNNEFANTIENEQQDDSYCSNHLLFDDWFFSSIAPEPNGFGAGGKSLKDNYTEFLMGADPLTNRAYRPIKEDMPETPGKADDIYKEYVAPTDSWRTIASRFVVDGMFNVNSTSEKAWRALLGHARNQRIPYLDSDGLANLSSETDYAFPRTSIAGDEESGKATPGTYYAATEFTGYRVVDDEFIDTLAREIVEQIRARGPFLSLSEFINRQLSTNEDLAKAGAIQAAIDAALEGSDQNPYSTLQQESYQSEADPPGEDDYVFRKAAIGYNTYGLPGWFRQADVLRPLAPILSARDDTFTIRCYGDSRNSDGKIIAQAWCEATVRRTRNFCDPSEEPDLITEPSSEVNQTYGRRYEMVSFRWLHPDEV